MLSPLVTLILPNLDSILLIISVTTAGSIWLILLSSTYHTMVHCFSLIVWLATQRPYGLSTKPKSFKVVEYTSYHKSANCTHPYNAPSSCRWRVFLPFSCITIVWKLDRSRRTDPPLVPVFSWMQYLSFKHWGKLL